MTPAPRYRRSVTALTADDTAQPARRPRERQAARGKRNWRLGVAGGAAAAALLVWALTTWVMAFYFIPSQSMSPTLDIGDRIIVDRLAVPARGDIIVFHDPGGWLDSVQSDSGLLVKRVIAIGGDRVEGRDGNVWVNGDPVPETYLPAALTPTAVNFDEQVPDGTLWVMGDNRFNSADSRFQKGERKFVPVGNVVGRATAVIWPLSSLRGL